MFLFSVNSRYLHSTMRFTVFIKLALLFLLSYETQAQTKFWINTSDKETQRKLDVLGLDPEKCSQWLGQCSFNLNELQVDQLLSTSVKLTPVLNYKPLSYERRAYLLSFALEQIGADVFINANLNGSGVKIGIIDGGFLNADKSEPLAHLFTQGHVLDYHDWITPDLAPYKGLAMLDDGHGTEVWQLIGGYDQSQKIQYGLATSSDYYLARTDHGGYEKRIEEDYIIEALEEMARKGVKLFNISLGYTTDYNDPSENYKVSDVDGKTSLLTQALDKAAIEKGLLFVVSAGNDGAEKWKTLSIPADAKNALTVGASKFRLYDKMDFSSIGPSALDYIKPNISVYSTLGTSFSAPVVTGLAACMMQYDSMLTNFEIIEMLERASNFYPYGNNYVGYGVPDCNKLMLLLQKREPEQTTTSVIHTNKRKIKLAADFSNKTVVIFHKENDWLVSEHLLLKSKKDDLKIKKPSGVIQTSVLLGKNVTEIIWE